MYYNLRERRALLGFVSVAVGGPFSREVNGTAAQIRSEVVFPKLNGHYGYTLNVKSGDALDKK